MSLLTAHIKELLRPFKGFMPKKALSATYRCLEILPDRVAGCSNDGMMEVFMKMGLDETIFIEAHPFLALLDSLPETEKLELQVEAGTLQWKCGNAKGKLALADLTKIQRMPAKMPKQGWKPPVGFIDGLRAGSLSCDSVSMLSAGLHGVAVHFEEERIVFASSDNLTISIVCLEYGDEDAPPEFGSSADGPLVISPEAAGLLADALAEDGQFSFKNGDILYWDEGTRILLRQMEPLKMDLTKAFKKFPDRKMEAPLPQDAVRAFVKRALALAEVKRESLVTLQAKKGKFTIAFDSGTASSEEFFMAKSLKMDGELSIQVEAARLARALEHIETVYMDYMGENGALIFAGSDPEFTYIVAGR